MSEVFGILFLTVVVPLWIIFHYIAKMRSSRGLTNEDEKMLSEIWESTRKMEDRINSLERILDADYPSWRGRS